MKTPSSKKARTLGALGERGFIKKILSSSASAGPAFLVPPGDDAVVLRNPGRSVLSIDGLTDGTHFRSRWARRCAALGGFSLGRGLGWKVLGCSLSDLAAMGRTTRRWAMIYLGAPGATSLKFLEELQRGTREAARRFDCALAGGDTVRAKDISLVAAVGGELAGKRALKRSGARPGDLLCVAGIVGDASIGLKLLDGKISVPSKTDAAHFVRSFFDPRPMFAAGAILSAENAVTSAIDLSDALKDSVEIICEASGRGARVNVDDVPVSAAYRRWFKLDASLLTGGEDYALLFTLQARALSRLRRRLTFSVIGRIVPRGHKVRYYRKGRTSPLNPISFQHFR